MATHQQEQVAALKKWFGSRQKVAVAFSGGVDSSLLLFLGSQVLGPHCLGIFALSPLMSRYQIETARNFVRIHNLPLAERLFSPFELPGFSENRDDRCYICKKGLYGQMKGGLAPGWHLADGTNLDDNPAERPGFQAILELGIATPFLDCRIGKGEIREMSRALGLSTWDLPSDSCLATRIPRYSALTKEGLRQVEGAEEELRNLGFVGGRARLHDDTILLTFQQGDLERALMAEVRRNIEKRMRERGFSKFFLDLSERQGILP